MNPRQKAKEEGLIRYTTGKPCLRGHMSERFTKSSSCCACHIERQQTPGVKAYHVAYNSANKKAAYERVIRHRAKKQHAIEQPLKD